MEKVNLEIQDYEDKRSKDKTKDYTRFKTNEGWMSCFDEDTIKNLKGCEGKTVAVDVATTNKDGREYKNIRKLYGLAGNAVNKVIDSVKEELITATEEQTSPRKTVKGTDYEKDPVGLAVELVCSQNMLMSEAIELVKQAQKAFS